MTAPIAPCQALVAGTGPAGLMAATVLARAGIQVDLFDAMPSPGRKFILAGRGGLNLTRAEDPAAFAARYRERAPFFGELLARFSPAHLRDFLTSLGVSTFVGSSGKVFPDDHTPAAEILRRWLDFLARLGVRLHARHRLAAIDDASIFRFTASEGDITVQPQAAILALGGASWPSTGSDGGWMRILSGRGIACTSLTPANSGIECGWSEHFRARFAGSPLKNLQVTGPDGLTAVGEAVVTGHGLEGSAIYPLTPGLRAALAVPGSTAVRIDLKRDLETGEVHRRLAEPHGKLSTSEFLRRRLRLDRPAYSLLRECAGQEVFETPKRLAEAIKGLRVPVVGLRPLSEAISSAGGVEFSELDEWLMLKKLPGVFAAGEMLDWEAPTGGYLLQGCFSTGWLAGQGALRLLRPERALPEAPVQR